MRIYDQIEELFGFDIRTFFIDFNNFVSYDLQNMINFYQGLRNSPIEVSQEKLNLLSETSDLILSKIEETKKLLDFVEFYDIVDEFEDCRLKILTYSNMKKWLGVNDIKSIHRQNNTVNYVLSRNESLDIAASKLGYTNRDDGGLQIALENSIKESDYTLEGGFLFQFNFQDEKLRINLSSVVDKDMNEEKLMGYDISKKIEFSENDLSVLSAIETFEQTCLTLLRLKRGDNPEFPYDGIDKTLLVNRISTSTAFPIILRQLNDCVSKDDTIKRMELKDVWFEKDSLNLQCNFYSQLSTSITVNYEN